MVLKYLKRSVLQKQLKRNELAETSVQPMLEQNNNNQTQNESGIVEKSNTHSETVMEPRKTKKKDFLPSRYKKVHKKIPLKAKQQTKRKRYEIKLNEKQMQFLYEKCRHHTNAVPSVERVDKKYNFLYPLIANLIISFTINKIIPACNTDELYDIIRKYLEF